MIMSNFLLNRKSVRDFKNKKVSDQVLLQIRNRIKEILREENTEKLNFKMYENGHLVFNNLEGKAGYSGVMIESPHYIALEWKDNKLETLISGSYYMEKLITEMNKMGISTCWITLPVEYKVPKVEALGLAAENIDYVLAFGYEKLRNPFSKEVSSERLGVEDIVFLEDIERKTSMDALEAKGLLDIFYYVRFAPSMKNRQPWRFLIEGDKVKLLLSYKEWEEYILVDGGIIMYYFEELAKMQGISNMWELVDLVDYEGKDANYKLVAEYKL